MRYSRQLALAALIAAPICAVAQVYPTKPIHMIVPYAAGTTTDILARQLSAGATTILGQPIVIENRAGASGTLGANAVARAAPDGYTLVFAANQTHATNAVLMRNLPYDPIKNFTPVARLAVQPQVLVVHPSLNVKTVAELAALAKSNPGTISFASTGNGTGAHLSGELFKIGAGVDLLHVPYSTSSQVFTELLAGTTKMMFYPYAPLKGYITAGKLVPIATTGTERSPWLPDVPTMIEAGYPGFVMSSWFAIYGPAGLPTDIADKVAAAYRTVLDQPEVRAQLEATGTIANFGDRPELAKFTVSEIERVRKVATASNLSLE